MPSIQPIETGAVGPEWASWVASFARRAPEGGLLLRACGLIFRAETPTIDHRSPGPEVCLPAIWFGIHARRRDGPLRWSQQLAMCVIAA